MYTLLMILIGVACLLLILVVLVQNSKGGGLASNFAGSNQFMGVRKTTDFIEKFTWGLAIAVLVFSLAITTTIPHGSNGGAAVETELTNQLKNEQAPAPAAPVAPAEQQAAPVAPADSAE
ncbi:MAG: preprotein translocase subunit SecG [Bacteroidales bacterium]